MIDKINNITFIGTGKISYSIAAAIKSKNFNIDYAVSRSLGSIQSFCKKFNIKEYSDNIDDINIKEGLFIIAVPDDEIASVANDLAKNKVINFEDSCFIHLSGVHTSDLLIPLKEKKAAIASVHIMQTFPDKCTVNFIEQPCSIETDSEEIFNLLKSFLESLKLVPFKLKKEKKAAYHLAGVFCSNFLFSNLYFAEQLYNSLDIKEYPFFYVFKNLLVSSLNNTMQKGASQSVSGPLIRGDISTIKKHLNVLENSIQGHKGIVIESYVIQSIGLLTMIEERNKVLTEKQQNVRQFLTDYYKKIHTD